MQPTASLAVAVACALVAIAAFVAAPARAASAPANAKEAEAAVENKPPHQISIEFDSAEQKSESEGQGRGANTNRGEQPYFASYDATELSRMYSSFSSLTEAVPGQPVWDGHDLSRHPHPMASTRTTARTIELDHHRPVIDAHGNVQAVAPHELSRASSAGTGAGSMKDFIADQKEAREEAKADEQIKQAKAQAEAQALAQSKEEDRKREAALKAAQVLLSIRPPVPTPAALAAAALVPANEEKAKIARDIFRRQNAEGLVKELTPMNVMFYVSRNQPFALFLLCDCADDYDLAVVMDELVPQLTAKGHAKRMLFLSVGPQIAAHFNLWHVFALAPPPVGQGPLRLGPNDILVGDSKTSNTKTVAVTFAAADAHKFVAVNAAITNECCGDKFVLRVEHLDGTGFHLVTERVDNKDQPGWGQQLVVRWAGETADESAAANAAGGAHDKAAKQADAEKAVPKVPAVVIDNIPMGSMNEKFVFSRGSTGPIESRALLAFFDDFQAQTLPLFVRSQTPAALAPGVVAPAPQPGEVTAVYGNTFRELVLNRHTDVLVLVYSPFCGGSHAVMPIFEQAAAALATEPNVRFVKFDKTQNDFPVRGIRIIHYPTVLLFPAGDFSTDSYQFFDFDDYNGSKTPHQRDVPHSHFSVKALVQFVHDKGQMSTGSGQHFHLSGPNAHGELHARHPDDPQSKPAGAHDHDHDHDHGHDHSHDHGDI